MAQTNKSKKVKTASKSQKAATATATATVGCNKQQRQQPRKRNKLTNWFFRPFYSTFFIHNYNITIEQNALLSTTPCINVPCNTTVTHVRVLLATGYPGMSVFFLETKSKFINIIYHYSSLLYLLFGGVLGFAETVDGSADSGGGGCLQLVSSTGVFFLCVCAFPDTDDFSFHGKFTTEG